MNLLEKAKKSNKSLKKLDFTNEHFDVAVAFVRGEITHGQLADALGRKNSGNILYFVAAAIKEGVKRGRIKLTIKR